MRKENPGSRFLTMRFNAKIKVARDGGEGIVRSFETLLSRKGLCGRVGTENAGKELGKSHSAALEDVSKALVWTSLKIIPLRKGGGNQGFSWGSLRWGKEVRQQRRTPEGKHSNNA